MIRRTHRRPPVTLTPLHAEGVRQLSDRGLLQHEIAQRLGISTSSVARIQALYDIPHADRSAGWLRKRARVDELSASVPSPTRR